MKLSATLDEDLRKALVFNGKCAGLRNQVAETFAGFNPVYFAETAITCLLWMFNRGDIGGLRDFAEQQS